MEKILFDHNWSYFMGDYMPFAPFPAQISEEHWKSIDLPHDAIIGLKRDANNSSGMAEAYTRASMLYYRKQFVYSKEWNGKKILIEFEGIYMNSEIIINGNHVQFHPYGYTGFIVDLTPYLLFDSANELIVTVNNLAKPNSRWYSGAGIYRHVWLRICNSIHVKPWGVQIITDHLNEFDAAITVKTVVRNHAKHTTGYLLYKIATNDSEQEYTTEHKSQNFTIKQNSEEVIETRMEIKDPLLWDMDHPNLYTLQYELLVEGEYGYTVMDHGMETFGLRTISFDSRDGFRLNGRTVKLKGGCIHHDHGPLGAASYDEAEERKLSILKSSGFEAIRSAHNPPSPKFLELCDKMGILVINEIFDGWQVGKVAHDYHLYFQDWWKKDLEAVVERDFNHPSVIMRSIGNEVAERDGSSRGNEICKRISDYTKELDSTRPTMVASNAIFVKAKEGEDNNWAANIKGNIVNTEHDLFGNLTEGFFAGVDIAGYNYLTNRYQYDREKYPDRVIIGSETYPHEMFQNWHKMLQNNNVIGDFVWTAYDYLGESGVGKVEYEQQNGWGGAYPWYYANCGDFDVCGFKRPQSYYRDILWGRRKKPYIGVYDPAYHGKKILFKPWGWEPVLSSFTFPGFENRETSVDIYCAYDEIELFVNDISYGRKKSGIEVEYKTSYTIKYDPGSIRAVAYENGRVAEETIVKTAGKPQKIKLTPEDRDGSLIFIKAEIVDQNDNHVPYCQTKVEFFCNENGRILATGNGNPQTEESFTDHSKTTYEGKALLIVKRESLDKIKIKACADGLEGTEIEI